MEELKPTGKFPQRYWDKLRLKNAFSSFIYFKMLGYGPDSKGNIRPLTNVCKLFGFKDTTSHTWRNISHGYYHIASAFAYKCPIMLKYVPKKGKADENSPNAFIFSDRAPASKVIPKWINSLNVMTDEDERKNIDSSWTPTKIYI